MPRVLLSTQITNPRPTPWTRHINVPQKQELVQHAARFRNERVVLCHVSRKYKLHDNVLALVRAALAPCPQLAARVGVTLAGFGRCVMRVCVCACVCSVQFIVAHAAVCLGFRWLTTDLRAFASMPRETTHVPAAGSNP